MPDMRRSNDGRKRRGLFPAPGLSLRGEDGEEIRKEEEMIVVTGSVTARERTFDEVRQLSLEHVHRSRNEPGCISHAVHVDCEDPLRLVFLQAVAGRGRAT